MATPFKGTINVDIRDSEPDWTPFEPPKAPDGAPDVVYIVLDDVGFSAMNSYGGPIDTPNIDRIAADGIRYTQWHTTALCSPTRSCLLTGRNHTRNSMACITEAASDSPTPVARSLPRTGCCPRSSASWMEHLHGGQMAPLPRRRDEPRVHPAQLAIGPRLRALVRLPRRGDEPVVSRPRLRQPSGRPAAVARGGLPPHRGPDRQGHRVHPDAKAIAPEKPFFLYYAPGAATRPHHVPRSGSTSTRAGSTWATRRCGARPSRARRSSGSSRPTPSSPDQPDRHAETRTGPDGKPFPPVDVTRPWASLSDDEQRLFARMAEVYAGFLSHADHHIGRLLDYLEDDGPAREHARHRGLGQRCVRRGRPERLGERDEVRERHPGHVEANMRLARRAGRDEDLQPLPERLGDGLQHAVQDVEALRVQRRHERPVHHLLARRDEGEGRAPDQYHHAIDIVPTVLDCLGVEAPETIKGTCAVPFDGVSMRYGFDDADAPTTRRTQFYSMLGSRGIWHDGWKAITTHPTIAGWSHFNDDEWELYHTEVDRAEIDNLADKYPEKVRELASLWFPRRARTTRSRWTTAPRWRS